MSFLPGETSDYPYIQKGSTLQALESSAKLLRAYHDALQNFLNKENFSDKSWMLEPREPREVICHGDFAPYNICFEGEQAVGMIDFDTVHPGPRTWDIAYAIYRFAPFFTSSENIFGNLDDQIVRGRLFCDAYGLTKEERLGMPDLIIERLEKLLDFMIKSAQEGNEKYILTIQNEHHLKYFTDIDYIKLHIVHIKDGLNKIC